MASYGCEAERVGGRDSNYYAGSTYADGLERLQAFPRRALKQKRIE